jgi:hypothetical protein
VAVAVTPADRRVGAWTAARAAARVEGQPRALVIGCGALATELVRIAAQPGLEHVDVVCLAADLHNRPERIAAGVRRRIRDARPTYAAIFVAYADCGTRGELDRVLAEERVERLAGPHCYATYAGRDAFAALAAEEPGTFYLTDFLARHFDSLVVRGLGIDRHPELIPVYFGHYRRLVYLAQTDDADLGARARRAAARLGLQFAYRRTGLGEMWSHIADFAQAAATATVTAPATAPAPAGAMAPAAFARAAATADPAARATAVPA